MFGPLVERIQETGDSLPVNDIALGTLIEVLLQENQREIDMRLAMIAAAALVAMFGTGQVAAADGKAVFEKSCAGCHKAMSPKLTGDKAKWDVLLKQGAPALAASVIKGKGTMPPKGGAASEDDAKAATEYMLTQIK